MNVEPGLALDDPERAHVLLRCTQEIITNAVRHAGASKLWIDCRHEDGQVVIEARDDGRGAEQVVAGNGLRGLRERLRLHGGDVSIDPGAGRGFQLRLRMPLGTLEPWHDGDLPAASVPTPEQEPASEKPATRGAA